MNDFTFAIDYEHTENLNGKRNGLMDVNGNKRNPAVVAGAKALLSNPKVQEAVVEKGIEVAGRLVDKQLQIIDDAQQKAADFLKKEASFLPPICSKFRSILEIRLLQNLAKSTG